MSIKYNYNRFKYYLYNIPTIINYIKKGDIPFISRTKNKNHFISKYQNIVIKKNNKLSKYKDLKWHNRKKRFYLDNKEIVFQEEIKQLLIIIYFNRRYGYVGRDKLYHFIKQNFIGVSIRSISKFLNNVEIQQVYKSYPKKLYSVRTQEYHKPNIKWEMDLSFLKIRHHQKQMILFNIIDVVSKYAWSRIVSDKTQESIVYSLINIVQNNHYPKIFGFDNGTEFKNKLLIKLIKHVLHSHYSFGRSYCPNDQAIIERFNKTIKFMITKYLKCTQQSSFSQDELNDFVENYNNKIHSTTKFIPNNIHPSQSIINISQIDYQKKVLFNDINISLYNKKYYNHQCRLHKNLDSLKIGDCVRLDIRMFQFKPKKFSKVYKEKWTYKIFKILAISNKLSSSCYHFLKYKLGLNENEKSLLRTNWFSRMRLLKINQNAVIKYSDYYKLYTKFGGDSLEKIVNSSKQPLEDYQLKLKSSLQKSIKKELSFLNIYRHYTTINPHLLDILSSGNSKKKEMTKSNIYEIETILDKRIKYVKSKSKKYRPYYTEYLVKWKNYDKKFNSWVKKRYLKADLLLKEFENQSS